MYTVYIDCHKGHGFAQKGTRPPTCSTTINLGFRSLGRRVNSPKGHLSEKNRFGLVSYCSGVELGWVGLTLPLNLNPYHIIVT